MPAVKLASTGREVLKCAWSNQAHFASNRFAEVPVLVRRNIGLYDSLFRFPPSANVHVVDQNAALCLYR
jgi:hypothetical protein